MSLRGYHIREGSEECHVEKDFEGSDYLDGSLRAPKLMRVLRDSCFAKDRNCCHAEKDLVASL